jgi:hypothetical protein
MYSPLGWREESDMTRTGKNKQASGGKKICLLQGLTLE